MLGLLNRFVPNDGVYRGGVLLAAIVSLGDAVLSVAPSLTGLQDLMGMLPLHSQGFAWVIPAVIGAAAGGIICRGKPKYQPPEEDSEARRNLV